MEEATGEIPIHVVHIQKLLRLLVSGVLDMYPEGIGLLEDVALLQENIEIKGELSASMWQYF